VVLATVVALGTLSSVFGAVVLKRVGLGFSAPLCRRLFGFGLPMVPSALALAGIAVVERYFLNTLAGAAAVGLYSLASRLASLLQMFVAAPFAQTFAVRRVETLVKGEQQDIYNRILLLFTLLMCSCGLFLSIFAHDLIALIAPGDYADAALIVPWLALAFVLAALGFNFELGLHFTKYTRVLPLINGVALLLAVIANALLIPRFGLLGCALALALVNAVRLALTVALNLRFGSAQIHLDWWRALPVLALFTAAGLAVVHTDLAALHPAWLALKLLAFVLWVVAAACSPLLDTASRDELRTAWRHLRPRQRPA
jgi:O-antigen/teichoic acid export membrane protein